MKKKEAEMLLFSISVLGIAGIIIILIIINTI